jgi:hypothetical protein
MCSDIVVQTRKLKTSNVTNNPTTKEEIIRILPKYTGSNIIDN